MIHMKRILRDFGIPLSSKETMKKAIVKLVSEWELLAIKLLQTFLF